METSLFCFLCLSTYGNWSFSIRYSEMSLLSFFACTLVLYSHTFDKLYIYRNVLASQTFQCLTYYVFPHASIDLFEFTSFVHPTPTPTPTSSNPSTLFVSLFCWLKANRTTFDVLFYLMISIYTCRALIT